jgi:Ser/Thr protein kinase RdoA (MazF antagonist)
MDRMRNWQSTVPDVSPWPGLELVDRLEGGARNAVYLGRRRGHDFVVRASERPHDSLQWEIDLLLHLRKEGFLVPRLIPTNNGSFHADGIMVHEFIPGQPPADTQDWTAVTNMAREVHNATRGWEQRPRFASSLELQHVRRGGDVRLDQMDPEDVDLIRAAWAQLPVTEQCVIHGDLGASNILVNDGNVAFIDWDEARTDLPWFDFADIPVESVEVSANIVHRAGLAWEAATCWAVEPEYAREVLDALRTPGTPS